ncbi:MAG: hypothetical protein AMJ65_17680 [Phycisphaerae bacterium SG8_4]|nr:MAG: hypothetical protein AMJ65_17680 [Phycisphaerae bacterium SG8_4]
MLRYVRPRLKALPILDPATFSSRSVISVLLTISETSPLGETTTKTALDRLSDAELEEYTKPKEITSASEAHAYMANTETQSAEYAWRRNGQYIFLLAASRHAKDLGVPGIVFEFMIRTGASQWTVYQIPDPDNVFEHAVHFYRNELMAYSQRPVKSPIHLKPKRVRGKLYGLGRTLGRAAAYLFA